MWPFGKSVMSIFLSLSHFMVLVCFASAALAQSTYKASSSEQCDGFPLIEVGTVDGTCLGLVADRNLKDERTSESLLFPRKMVELAPGRFLVLDMGGWSPKNRGALWELDVRTQPHKLWKLVKGLTIPHGLAWGPDQNLYVGEVHQIVRYSREALMNRKVLQGHVVVSGLEQTTGVNMHPLINFTFGQSVKDRGDLYVNMGAPSDACVKDAPRKCSVEGQQGLIRHYRYLVGINSWSPNFQVLATGLRNSMGLVSHTSGSLLQAENSRDFKDDNEPFDELNLIEASKHYGWPYCYNFQATSQEWQGVANCKADYQAPLILLPPHSAPLDLMYYNGDMFPQWRGHLLMSWHGYKPTGSRVVAYPTDTLGLPQTQIAETWEYSFGRTRQVARPQGGNLRAAPYIELISGWEKRDGIRPAGAPVGLLVASDGSIYIVEDKNKTIVRLAKSENQKQQNEPSQEDSDLAKKVKIYRALKKLESSADLLNAYNWINQNVLQTNCAGCHSQLKGFDKEAFEFMIGENWIQSGDTESYLIQRLKGANGYQKMPLGGALSDQTIQYIESWIKAL